jgi:hypothetical protein
VTIGAGNASGTACSDIRFLQTRFEPQRRRERRGISKSQI